MTRDLLTNPVVTAPTDQLQRPVRANDAAQNGTKPTSAVLVAQDTLAGSLPVWDLLPAAPFIRRVK